MQIPDLAPYKANHAFARICYRCSLAQTCSAYARVSLRTLCAAQCELLLQRCERPFVLRFLRPPVQDSPAPAVSVRQRLSDAAIRSGRRSRLARPIPTSAIRL